MPARGGQLPIAGTLTADSNTTTHLRGPGLRWDAQLHTVLATPEGKGVLASGGSKCWLGGMPITTASSPLQIRLHNDAVQTDLARLESATGWGVAPTVMDGARGWACTAGPVCHRYPSLPCFAPLRRG